MRLPVQLRLPNVRWRPRVPLPAMEDLPARVPSQAAIARARGPWQPWLIEPSREAGGTEPASMLIARMAEDPIEQVLEAIAEARFRGFPRLWADERAKHAGGYGSWHDNDPRLLYGLAEPPERDALSTYLAMNEVRRRLRDEIDRRGFGVKYWD